MGVRRGGGHRLRKRTQWGKSNNSIIGTGAQAAEDRASDSGWDTEEQGYFPKKGTFKLRPFNHFLLDMFAGYKGNTYSLRET